MKIEKSNETYKNIDERETVIKLPLKKEIKN